MISVKFDHSVKYNGTRYAAHEVFEVEEKDVESLNKSGAIIVSQSPYEPPVNDEGTDTTGTPSGDAETPTDGEGTNEGGEDVAKLKEELVTYTVPQLKAFAEERGIDLEGKTVKADIYNVIVSKLN